MRHLEQMVPNFGLDPQILPSLISEYERHISRFGAVLAAFRCRKSVEKATFQLRLGERGEKASAEARFRREKRPPEEGLAF